MALEESCSPNDLASSSICARAVMREGPLLTPSPLSSRVRFFCDGEIVVLSMKK